MSYARKWQRKRLQEREREGRRMFQRLLHDGNVMWVTMAQTINEMPFWARAGLAWSVLRGNIRAVDVMATRGT